MALKLFFVVSLLVSVKATPVDVSPRADDYRLPADVVKAVNYNLALTLANDVFTTNTFGGILTLTFQALTATNEIKIHANNLKFSVVELKLKSTGVNVPLVGNAEDFVSDAATEILTITTTNALTPNVDYEFYFVYEAVLRTDEMYGLYRSSYTDQNGNTKYLATTQFESTYARRVMPCFDEPSYKAAFEVKITHPSAYNARANTPRTTVTNAGTTVTTFEKSPIMPTYLLAFIISDFTCTDGEDIELNIPYAVCSRTESSSTRALAIEKGVPIMHALEELTGIKYSSTGIGKMDQYAIPDFAAGAMENWGIVTYRETGLLWDPEESANSYKQSIENVIAHEFAHMWFGNLVTTHWWSDTFLNEGFARYYQYFATAMVEPTWELDKQFVLAQVQTVFVTDSSSSAAALSANASTPAEISARFGTISYAKGGSVIRMIIHFMGEEYYKQGINKYLTTHSFGNTKPEDLWTALTPYTHTLPPGTTLNIVMDAWINKPGFPLLQVTLNGRNVVISQERFLADAEEQPNVNDKWFVPISYTTSTESDKFQDTSVRKWLLPDADLTIESALDDDNSWIILNNQEIGYYRVNYDNTLWERIKTALNTPGFGGIHELNRAQIVDDFYNMAKNGKQSYKSLFELLTFLKKDTAYSPWYSTLTAFNSMLTRTGNEKLRTALSKYIVDLLETTYNSLPFQESKDDNQIYTLHRAQIISLACRLGLTDCIDNAVAAFKAYRDKNTKVDKNLRSVIYCNGLRYSDDVENDWEILWNKYTTSKLATEQAILLTSLGCAKNKDVLNAYLLKTITENSGIRQQDASSVFSAVYSGNVEGVDIAFQFFIDNYVAITNYYTSMSSLNNLLTGIANRFTKQEQFATLTQFLQTPGLPESLKLAGVNAVAIAETNLALMEAFEKELDLYFLTSENEVPENEGSSASSLKVNWIITIVSVFLMFNKALR